MFAPANDKVQIVLARLGLRVAHGQEIIQIVDAYGYPTMY